MGTDDLLREVVRPAAGVKIDLRTAPDYLAGLRVGVEISGWLHKACRHGARDVVLHGVSRAAMSYITSRLSTLRGEGARMVVVFDGDRAFPPKTRCLEARAKGSSNLDMAKANIAAGVATPKEWQLVAAPTEGDRTVSLGVIARFNLA